jgi:hypothetical protein
VDITAVCRKVKLLLRHYSPSLLKMRSASSSAAAISLLTGILALQECVCGGIVVEAGMTYLYHPLDEGALFAFDARITEEYTALYAARGVSYPGTFRVVGPDGPCLADFVVFETASRAEAERLGEEDLPARIVAIEDTSIAYLAVRKNPESTK